ncbi:MAG: hypothetical protein F4100_05765, partial [Rhodothermaceae bacterium]|nr:hypothetical protein [Rhodothermaceae bacterium]
MDSRKTIAGFFLFAGGNRFRDCIRHALHSVGLWVLCFPIVVFAQVHAQQIQSHTEVEFQVLLSPNLQALKEREQDVIAAATLFSAEPRTAPFEAIRVSEGEFSQRSPTLVFPFFPHEESGTRVYVSSVDSIGNRWSDFEQLLNNTQNFSMVSVPESVDSVSIPVKIVDDGEDEHRETVILTLEDGAGYAINDPPAHTLAITNNNLVTAHFVLAEDRANENDGTHYIDATINPAPVSGFRLCFEVSGTARQGQDYTMDNSVFVWIPANETKVKIPVMIRKDFKIEGDETVILTLTNHLGYTLGSPSQHTLTIVDNTVPIPRFIERESSVDENVGTTPHKVRVDIFPVPKSEFTFSYTLKGTATVGFDYNTNSTTVQVPANVSTVKIPLTIIDDMEIEGDETVILNLEKTENHTRLHKIKHTLTIKDDDIPKARFDLVADRVKEDAGTRHVKVHISPVSASGFTLNYTTQGSRAWQGSDFTIPKVVQVPANAPSVDIPITIVDNSRPEDDEKVILKLTPATGYMVGSPGTHTLTILDDDDWGKVDFVLDRSGAKEDKGTHNVEVRISPAAIIPFVLGYNRKGTATPGKDYTSSFWVRVPLGAPSVEIPVNIIDDIEGESDETVILTLYTGGANRFYTDGSQITHTLTIEDNDASEAHFASTASSALEDTGTHEVEVRIDPVPASDFTLSYTLGGTADED